MCGWWFGRMVRWLLAGCAGVLCMHTAGAQSMGISSLVSQPTIYLYHSAATGAFFKANKTDYDDLIGHWRNYLNRYKTNLKILKRRQLLQTPSPGILILGSVALLDAEERAAIQKFLDNGGNLLATWGTGVRNGTGEWVGYDFIENLFQIKVKRLIPMESETWFLNTVGNGPLTWTLPPARRVFLGKTAEDLIAFEGGHLAGVYMDWNRSPEPGEAIQGMAYRETDKSRMVYFGFSESSWAFHTPQEFEKLLDACIGWLNRKPQLLVSPWPDGRQSAFLLEMDTEDKFQSAPFFARDLEEVGLRGTFYMLTSVAVQHREAVLDILARGHEVAYHADVHVGFKGQSDEVQKGRIANMKSQMASLIGDDIGQATGFRAPTESYDQPTEVLLRAVGILHHAADPNSTEDRLPFASLHEPNVGIENAVIVLPRTQHDDVSFKRLNYSIEDTRRSLIHDFNVVMDTGSFGLLSVHTQNYIKGGSMYQTVPSLLKHAARFRQRVWFERGDRIAQWWRAFSQVRMEQTETIPGQFDVRLTNAGKTALENFTLVAIFPHKNAEVALVPVDKSAPDAGVRVLDEQRAAIVLKTLPPGQTALRIRIQ